MPEFHRLSYSSLSQDCLRHPRDWDTARYSVSVGKARASPTKSQREPLLLVRLSRYSSVINCHVMFIYFSMVLQVHWTGLDGVFQSVSFAHIILVYYLFRTVR